MCTAIVVVAAVFSAARGRGSGVGSGVAAEKVLVTTGVHGVWARNAATAAVRPRDAVARTTYIRTISFAA